MNYEQVRPATGPPAFGTIPPVEALWKKKFQIQQTQINRELISLKTLIDDISNKQHEIASAANIDGLLAPLWRELEALKIASLNAPNVGTSIENLSTRLESSFKSLSQSIEATNARTRAAEDESAALKQRLDTLVERIDASHASYLRDIQELRMLAPHGSRTPDNQLLHSFLELENARHQVNSDAVAQIERLNASWRAKFTAAPAHTADHQELRGARQPTAIVRNASISHRATGTYTEQLQSPDTAPSSLNVPVNLPQERLTSPLALDSSHSAPNTAIPRFTRQPVRTRSKSKNSNSSSSTATFSGHQQNHGSSEPHQNHVELTQHEQPDAMPVGQFGFFDINMQMLPQPSSAISYPFATVHRAHQTSSPAIPFVRPNATLQRQAPPSIASPLIRNPTSSVASSNQFDRDLNPGMLPFTTPAPKRQHLLNSSRSDIMPYATPAPKRQRLNPALPPGTSHSLPMTAPQLHPRSRIVVGQSMTPSLSRHFHSSASANTTSLPFTTPQANRNRALPTPTMTSSSVHTGVGGHGVARTARHHPQRQPQSNRKPRRKVDNTPRPWDPSRPRTREQLKRQVQEHPELGDPSFVRLEY